MRKLTRPKNFTRYVTSRGNFLNKNKNLKILTGKVLLGRKREIQKELKKRFYSEYSSKCVEPENAPNIDSNFDVENPGMVINFIYRNESFVQLFSSKDFITCIIWYNLYLLSFDACGVSEYSKETWVDCCTPIGVIGSPTKLKVRTFIILWSMNQMSNSYVSNSTEPKGS